MFEKFSAQKYYIFLGKANNSCKKFEYVRKIIIFAVGFKVRKIN